MRAIKIDVPDDMFKQLHIIAIERDMTVKKLILCALNENVLNNDWVCVHTRGKGRQTEWIKK